MLRCIELFHRDFLHRFEERNHQEVALKIGALKI